MDSQVILGVGLMWFSGLCTGISLVCAFIVIRDWWKKREVNQKWRDGHCEYCHEDANDECKECRGVKR